MTEKRLTYDQIMSLYDRMAREASQRREEAMELHREAMEREKAALEREASFRRESGRLHKEAMEREKAALEREASFRQESERLHKEAMEREKAALERAAEETRRYEESRKGHEEANRRLDKSLKEHEEANRRLDKLEKLYGGTTENIGQHAEEFFQNALDKSLTFGGMKYDKLIPNLRVIGRENCEFDMVLVNCVAVALIEAKHRVHSDFVKALTTEKLAQFRKFFPEYADRRVYLGVAGFSFGKNAVADARRLGVGIVRQDGNTIEEDSAELKVY